MTNHENQRPRLSVIGTGYLGATHAICMASLGYDVIGVDVDEHKIDQLRQGRVPFFEPGLPELLAKTMETGRLRFTTDFAEAARGADVHFVCVGTPQQYESNAANMSYIDSAFTEMAKLITRKALLVGKSTVPVGTAQRLTEMVQAISPVGGDLELAWNPEFLREGFAVQDTLHPDRLIFGAESAWAMEQLYASFAPIVADGIPVVDADLPTAELVKVAANSFLATKISYINAMSEVCEVTSADVKVLSEALGLDDRIGKRFLQPGLGFGGGCLPKDIRAFRHRADELGVSQAVRFLGEVDAINLRRRTRTVDLVHELVGPDLRGVRIAALGATFKPNSDDVRDAPALDVARMLSMEGGTVVVYDPEGMENAAKIYPDLDYAESAPAAVQDADVVVLLTEWDEFRNADPELLGELVRRRQIVDARHALDLRRWKQADWTIRALGRPVDKILAKESLAA
jgi:UDPglucose 6-dehydrogenase